MELLVDKALVLYPESRKAHQIVKIFKKMCLAKYIEGTKCKSALQIKILSQENVWKWHTSQLQAQHSECIWMQSYVWPDAGKAPDVSNLILPNLEQAKIKVACAN